MAPLLGWGLPTSRHDELLFGGRPPWKAARYDAQPVLRQLATRDAGADTDLNPITDRDRIIDLTADDASRAEILRRYRLFSRQPDEMIVFRALQRMDPRKLDFDPQLYQYGGGYVYLIGAALGAAGLVGLVQLTGDAGVYLERPESFARFYVVARAVSLAFGALTLVAVSRLARRAGGRNAGWIAVLCVAAGPVFITAVLEAKPHLPSACLLLWATLSALDYQGRGRWQDAVRMGLQAGYAFGLVLTGLVGILLWPALLVGCGPNRRRTAVPHLALAGILALAVYVLTNPYVPYNWLTGRVALSSNLANSLAMYRDQVAHATQGAVRVAQLLVESAGIGVVLIGIAGFLLLLRRRPAATTIAAAAGIGTLLVGVLLGAGKPAEFARFLILPVLLLGIASAWLLAAIVRRQPPLGFAITVLVLTTMSTTAYYRAFLRDARGQSESRLAAARYLERQMADEDAVGVLQEPAPYSVPPLDFTRCRVLLLPEDRPANLDVAELPAWLVFTADDQRVWAGAWWHDYYGLKTRFPAADAPVSRIAWADKPTFVYRRWSTR
jgi:hypothetical protein